MEHSGTWKCVIKNDSGMDETSATLTIKKVEEKKKKKEEEQVEETIQVEEEIEDDEDEPETKKGPFDVKLKKAKQNKTVIQVSKNYWRRGKFSVICFYVRKKNEK